MQVTADDIANAARAIASHVQRTPTIHAPRLGDALGCRLFLKLENLQYTGSFKDRGSCLKLQRLAQQKEPPSGVVAASAGNHAQGVAFHARRLGMQAIIVMPQTTPFSKVERTEALGAEVLLRGESVAESTTFALEVARERNFAFVHPYDDAVVVAGQGTVALEMLEDRPNLDTIVVPVGGGGLCAGIAVWAKAKKPNIRIFGVQTELCPSMHAKLRGEPLRWVKTAHAYPSRAALMVHKRLLGEILVDLGYLTRDQVRRAVQSKPPGLPLGEYLVRQGRLTDQQRWDALALQAGGDALHATLESEMAS